MNLPFKPLFNTTLLVLPRLWSARTATHFEDVTCINLKLTSIQLTFSKGLSYLHICEIREPIV